jgi:hypothetical protein
VTPLPTPEVLIEIPHDAPVPPLTHSNPLGAEPLPDYVDDQPPMPRSTRRSVLQRVLEPVRRSMRPRERRPNPDVYKNHYTF